MDKYLSRNYTQNELKAIERYFNGEKYSCTTFIDEETITCGYGTIYSVGSFEFELPLSFRKEMNIMCGCKTWKEYFKAMNRIKKLERICDTK